jgi:hypothetical protein
MDELQGGESEVDEDSDDQTDEEFANFLDENADFSSESCSGTDDEGPVDIGDAPPQTVQLNPSSEASSFSPWRAKHADHQLKIQSLPREQAHIIRDDPAKIIDLFLPLDLCDTIALNTNTYRDMKSSAGQRRWRDVTKFEIRAWFGMLIYMGVHREANTSSYFNSKASSMFPMSWPHHPLLQRMGQKRFEQIKQFLHICDPLEGQKPHYWYKVDPLWERTMRNMKKYIVPGTHIAIDEMMVRFKGRSKYKTRIKGKPTPVGFRMIALCDSDTGAMFCMLPVSARENSSSVEKLKIKVGENAKERVLSAVSNIVVHLVRQLPKKDRSFKLYTDNYYTNVALLKYLREKEDVGACGTARTNSGLWPKSLVFSKEFVKKRDWNHVEALHVDGSLCFCWWDNQIVKFISTMHSHTDSVYRDRKRPAKGAFNAAIIRKHFGETNAMADIIRPFWTPQVAVDYTAHMGGVDNHDQLRSYTSIVKAFRSRKYWFPLLFFALDTIMVNSYIMLNHFPGLDEEMRSRIPQRTIFHHAVAEYLISSAFDVENEVEAPRTRQTKRQNIEKSASNSGRKVITKNYVLPIERLRNHPHELEIRKERRSCAWCRYLRARGFSNDKFQNKVQTFCVQCNQPLCTRNTCWNNWHSPYYPK